MDSFSIGMPALERQFIVFLVSAFAGRAVFTFSGDRIAEYYWKGIVKRHLG